MDKVRKGERRNPIERVFLLVIQGEQGDEGLEEGMDLGMEGMEGMKGMKRMNQRKLMAMRGAKVQGEG